VLPVFAFVAAGVPLGGLTLQDIVSNVPVGIAIGLILGKPAGVLAACFFVTRMKFAKMPTGATPMEMIGVACLCGIGFTMSLFLAALAFHTEPLAQAEARIGVLAGSIGATLLASVFFALSRGPKMQDIKP